MRRKRYVVKDGKIRLNMAFLTVEGKIVTVHKTLLNERRAANGRLHQAWSHKLPVAEFVLLLDATSDLQEFPIYHFSYMC